MSDRGPGPSARGAEPSISLVVCTRDRRDALRRLLASVDAARRPEAFELVVVDNGSRDGTAEVLAAHAAAAAYPVAVVAEPRPGLGRARNAGIGVAAGEVVAFTDDDCRLERTHLVTLAQAFATHPIDFCGGRILAAGPGDGPVALNQAPGFCYYLPGRPIAVGQVQGANMAMRGPVLRALGGFDPALGAGTRFRCEDIDVCARALARGHRGAHLPDLVVFHAHGRRGAELAALRRANERATGAFIAKRALDGERQYVTTWARTSMRTLGRRPANTARSLRSRGSELWGAAGYVGARLRAPSAG